MIKLAREHDKVVITATQMMESMITNPVPTRAEVSDVANAVLDGTDAVMLSAETAAGKYPLETVVEMAKICHAAESHEIVNFEADFMGKTFGRIDQSIAMGALFTAYHMGAKAIVALTDSGSTALWMSRHLIQIPIYALTPRVATQRKMALVPQCASAADGQQPGPRHRADGGREPSEVAQHRAKRRRLCHHLRRTHGRAGRHQHAQDLPGGLSGLRGARGWPPTARGGRALSACRCRATGTARAACGLRAGHGSRPR